MHKKNEEYHTTNMRIFSACQANPTGVLRISKRSSPWLVADWLSGLSSSAQSPGRKRVTDRRTERRVMSWATATLVQLYRYLLADIINAAAISSYQRVVSSIYTARLRQIGSRRVSIQHTVATSLQNYLRDLITARLYLTVGFKTQISL
eukprot:scaffold9537_cov41-Prasinocladus_malaysianus.AAC.1